MRRARISKFNYLLGEKRATQERRLMRYTQVTRKIWGGHETARFNDALRRKKSKTRWVSPQFLIIPVTAMFYLTPPGLEAGYLTAVGPFQQYHAGA